MRIYCTKLYTDDLLDHDDVFGTTRTWIVTVGDIDEYEVEAETKDEAAMYVVEHYFTEDDYEEYEDDPNYVWVIEKED